jgi:hypothetical protein
VLNRLGQAMCFGFQLAGVTPACPRCEARGGLGGEGTVPVGERRGMGGNEFCVPVGMALGHIELTDCQCHGGDKVLGASVVGDRADLHPVMGGGVGRVQRLLLLFARSQLGKAVVDQVPRAVVQLNAEPAVQVPAAALLRDDGGRQIAPACRSRARGLSPAGRP